MPQLVDGPSRWGGVILVAVYAVWSVLALLLAMVSPWPVATAILLLTVGTPAWAILSAWRRRS